MFSCFLELKQEAYRANARCNYFHVAWGCITTSLELGNVIKNFTIMSIFLDGSETWHRRPNCDNDGKSRQDFLSQKKHLIDGCGEGGREVEGAGLPYGRRSARINPIINTITVTWKLEGKVYNWNKGNRTPCLDELFLWSNWRFDSILQSRSEWREHGKARKVSVSIHARTTTQRVARSCTRQPFKLRVIWTLSLLAI